VRNISIALVGVAFLLTATLGVRAQPPAGQRGAAPANPLVPTTASSLLRDPKAHIGDNVSLMATVEAILSKTAFTLDQDATKTAPKTLLVLAPTLNEAPDLNGYVTVQGEVLLFDPAEIAKRNKSYTIDLPADLAARYQGQPVILATAVVTPKLVDLAKKPIVPMTPEELQFQKAMLAINPASAELRGLMAAPDAAKIKEQTAILKKAFTEVEAFFKKRGTTEAAAMAGEALKIVTGIEASAQAGKLEELKTAAVPLQQLCAQCHGAYRERQDDGTFRIRSGG
jgi:hypothetical protein